jgi:hypothetical protein
MVMRAAMCMGAAPKVDRGVLKYCEGIMTSAGTVCQLQCDKFSEPSSGDVTKCGWNGEWVRGTSYCKRTLLVLLMGDQVS